MNLKANFNTLTGPMEVIYTAQELVGTDLWRIYQSLLSQREFGVIGGTYDLPQYGRIELNLVEEK